MSVPAEGAFEFSSFEHGPPPSASARPSDEQLSVPHDPDQSSLCSDFVRSVVCGRRYCSAVPQRATQQAAGSTRCALDNNSTAPNAEALLCVCLAELQQWRDSVKSAHDCFIQDVAGQAHEGRGRGPRAQPARGVNSGAGLFSLGRAANCFRVGEGEPASVARVAEALGPVHQEAKAGTGKMEAAPDNVELRLGYGAMLLGKVGSGAHACSLRTILGQAAKACAVCTVAVACIKDLVDRWRSSPGSTDEDASGPDQQGSALGSLGRVCDGLFAMWAEFCHAMMQPLQGAVDVQAALRCSMSPDFAETATDRFTPATDGHPAVSKMQFVADLLIKLGVVQVQIMHDLRSGDAAPRSAGGRPAAASESTVDNGPCMQSAAPPAGLDHFLQANRMRMNCTHAVEYGLFSEQRARPVRKMKPTTKCSRCPVTGKIFRFEGPQQPLALPCCGTAVSVEGVMHLASQNKLRDSKPTGVKMHADDCTHEPALPADLRRYEVHDEEFEAACCADAVELQAFDEYTPAASEGADVKSEGGVGAGQAAPVHAVALGRDMFWESRKISTFVKRVPLPGTPVSQLDDLDWYTYLQLHDLDAFMATTADAGLDASLSDLISSACEERLSQLLPELPEAGTMPHCGGIVADNEEPCAVTLELPGLPGAVPRPVHGAGTDAHGGDETSADQGGDMTDMRDPPTPVLGGNVLLPSPAAVGSSAELPRSRDYKPLPPLQPASGDTSDATTDKGVTSARPWVSHADAVPADAVLDYLTAAGVSLLPTAIEAPALPGEAGRGVLEVQKHAFDFEDAVFVGLRDLQQLQQPKVSATLLQGLAGLKLHGCTWPDPGRGMLPGGRSVVFQVLPPPGDSDQELVALTVFSDEAAFQQRLRPYGLPNQAYLRSLLPRIYDFGYGANDLDRDERNLLSNTESRKAIAVLKRPFMVVQLGENLVQVCERVLAAVRAASASDAQGPQLHANLRSGDASATSTNNANRLARLTAIRKVLEGAASCIVRLHDHGFAHRKITPEKLLYFKGDDTWRFASCSMVCSAGASVESTVPPEASALPQVVLAHLRKERLTAAQAEDAWSFGVIACNLLSEDSPIGTPSSMTAEAPGERLDSRVPPWGAPAQSMHAELRSSEVGRAALRLVALDAADRWSVRHFLGNLQSTPESNEPLPGPLPTWGLQPGPRTAQMLPPHLSPPAPSTPDGDSDSSYTVLMNRAAPTCSEQAAAEQRSSACDDAVKQLPLARCDLASTARADASGTGKTEGRRERLSWTSLFRKGLASMAGAACMRGPPPEATKDDIHVTTAEELHVKPVDLLAAPPPLWRDSFVSEYAFPLSAPTYPWGAGSSWASGAMHMQQRHMSVYSGGSDHTSVQWVHAPSDGRSNAFTSRGSTFVRNDSSTSSVYGASSGRATPASAAAVSRELEVPLQLPAAEESQETPFCATPRSISGDRGFMWAAISARAGASLEADPGMPLAGGSGTTASDSFEGFPWQSAAVESMKAGASSSSTLDGADSHTRGPGALPPSPPAETASVKPPLPSSSGPRVELSRERLKQALKLTHARNRPLFSQYWIAEGCWRSGRYSLVQFARDKDTHDEVAIKFYMQPADFEREREAFSTMPGAMPATLLLKEGESLPVSDVPAASCPIPPCVVMQKGQSLGERPWTLMTAADPAQGPSLVSVLTALGGVISALEELHSTGVVHRDIKPGNILCIGKQHDRRWTFVDFGYAAKAGTTASLQFSPKYSSPEVLRAYYNKEVSIKVDAAFDIWALGIVMFELLTGHLAFPTRGLPSETADNAVRQAMLGQAPLPWEALSEVARKRLDAAQGLKAAVLQCLKREARLRPTAAELRESWMQMLTAYMQPDLSIASQATASTAWTGSRDAAAS